MAFAGSLTVNANVNLTDFEKGMVSLQKQMGKMSRLLTEGGATAGAGFVSSAASFAKLSGAMSAGILVADGLKAAMSAVANAVTMAGKAAAGFAIDSVKSFADLEQTRTALNVFLKDAAKTDAFLADMMEFANVTPFETDEVLAAGKQLLAFGVPVDEVMSKLRVLGDIASGVGSPLSELVLAFGKAESKGKVLQETLDLFTERGVPILESLRQKFGLGSTEEMLKAISKGEVDAGELFGALESMTAEGGLFFGMMDKQSQTLGGLGSTISGNWETLKAGIGEAIVKSLDLKTVFLEIGKVVTAMSSVIGQMVGEIDVDAASQRMVGFGRVLVSVMEIGVSAVQGLIAATGMLTVAFGIGFDLISNQVLAVIAPILHLSKMLAKIPFAPQWIKDIASMDKAVNGMSDDIMKAGIAIQDINSDAAKFRVAKFFGDVRSQLDEMDRKSKAAEAMQSRAATAAGDMVHSAAAQMATPDAAMDTIPEQRLGLDLSKPDDRLQVENNKQNDTALGVLRDIHTALASSVMLAPAMLR